MTEQEWQESEVMEEASDELFGTPDVEASLYHCGSCERDLLAADVHWSQEGEARCPRCGRPLDEV